VFQFADFTQSDKQPLHTTPYVAQGSGRHLYRDAFKRLFDVCAVLLILPIAVPVVALLALLVMARDGHNPFFLQPRLGRGGRVFTLVKLRTMVSNAEQLLADHLNGNPQAAEQWQRKQKLLGDPRITRIGSILRRLSIDELPQIWNVLTGDMSLVGPRPMMTTQQRLYPGQDYYMKRPGITGLWQVSERHGSEFVSRAEYDSTYAKVVSWWTDLRILARTVMVVVRATGI